MSGPYNYLQATQHTASLRPRARLICVYGGGGGGVEWGALNYISNLLMEEPAPNNILLRLQRKGIGHNYESLEKCRGCPWLSIGSSLQDIS